MRLADLTGRRVVLLGLGRDVRAAVEPIARARPAGMVLVDDHPVADRPAADQLVDSGSSPADLRQCDLASAAQWGEVFVRSPGFPRYQPELTEALQRGGSMTTPVDLWMGTEGVERTVIGVTGTKGKSTVTDMIGRLAAGVSERVALAGNLGVPVFDEGWDQSSPLVVLEISSYQAADLHNVPDVAVVTMLSQDHLSWHGGVERYLADKLHVVRNDGGTARHVVAREGDAPTIDALVGLGVEPELVSLPELASVPERGGTIPEHRLHNAALAAAALRAAGGPSIAIEDVVAVAETSLPGRLDRCPGPSGLLCLDDALASNPSAAAAGLAWLRGLGRPTVLLLGGADRGVDPAPLVAEVAKWSPGTLRCVTLPENGRELAAACAVPVLASAARVRDAVAVAVGEAGVDDAVIFSPGAPTPAGAGNWETRSAEFRAALVNP